jgi:uncharacterized membrane protein
MNNEQNLETRKELDESLLMLVLITVIGAGLRLYHLGYKPLWFDEAILYWISNNSNLKDLLAQNAVINSTPPLFPILIRYITYLGNSEEILRLIPWIGGVASIPAMCFLSRQFINKYPALMMTFIVAIAQTQIKYSQELREYSLTFLLTSLILLFFVRFLKKQNQKDLVLMTAFMLFGVFLQYGISVLIIGLNIIYLYILISNRENRKSRLLKWISSQVIILAAALSVVALSLSRQTHFFEKSSSTSHYLYNAYWNGPISSLPKFSYEKTYEIIRLALSSDIFVFLVLLGFIFLIINFKKYSNPFLMFTVPTILTFILALLGFYPYHGGRQNIFLTPMIYVLAGFGINYLWTLDKKRWTVILLVAFPMITGMGQTWRYLNAPGEENIIPVVETLRESIGENDSVYIYYSAKPAFTYYYPEYTESNVVFGTNNRGKINQYFQEVDKILQQSDSVWFVFSHCWHKECDLIKNHIAKTHNIELMVKENNAFLYFVK